VGVAETAITARITAALRARGCTVYKTHSGGLTQSGVLDLIVCYEGRYLELEVKTPRGRVTPLQRHRIEQVRAARGWAGVVLSVRGALDALDEL